MQQCLLNQKSTHANDLTNRCSAMPSVVNKFHEFNYDPRIELKGNMSAYMVEQTKIKKKVYTGGYTNVFDKPINNCHKQYKIAADVL